MKKAAIVEYNQHHEEVILPQAIFLRDASYQTTIYINAHLAFSGDKKAKADKEQLVAKLDEAKRSLDEATISVNFFKKSASNWG